MRVTATMVYQQVLGDIQRVQTRLSSTQEKMASGQRINKPSDDPAGVQRTLELSHRSALNSVYLDTAQTAQARLDATDQALSGIGEIITGARQAALQGSNSGQPATALQALATKVRQLRDQLVDSANAEVAGHYLFAGSNVQQAPYVVDATQTYADTGDAKLVFTGNTDIMKREIGPGVSVPINVDVSANVTTLYHTLDKLAYDLDNGDTATVSSADLGAITTAQNDLLNQRAEVGALSARMGLAADRLSASGFQITKMLSGVRDADVTKLTLNAARDQTAYQMALQVGANLLQPTLMDFLR